MGGNVCVRVCMRERERERVRRTSGRWIERNKGERE